MHPESPRRQPAIQYKKCPALACSDTASARCCIVPPPPARNSGCTASAAPMRSSAAPSASVSELCGACSSTGAQASSGAGFCGESSSGNGGGAMVLTAMCAGARRGRGLKRWLSTPGRWHTDPHTGALSSCDPSPPHAPGPRRRDRTAQQTWSGGPGRRARCGSSAARRAGRQRQPGARGPAVTPPTRRWRQSRRASRGCLRSRAGMANEGQARHAAAGGRKDVCLLQPGALHQQTTLLITASTSLTPAPRQRTCAHAAAAA